MNPGAPAQSDHEAAHDASGLSSRRVVFALLALGLGGFAVGASEFVAMGLLSNIARDLVPALYSSSPAHADAKAAWTVTAYALGVVVGAPTIAAASARKPRKKVLLALLVVFIVASVASAVFPAFGLVLVARFVAGLPHGAYFGIASLVAADLVGPARRGRGVAIVIGGLTISNVVGVPVITWLGQNSSWRVAYLVVAGIFLLAFITVALAVPTHSGNPEATARSELRVLGRAQVWLALGTGSVGFGGLFAVYSYVGPLAENVTGIGVGTVPLVLVVIGVGMTSGNFVGGWAADRDVCRAMYGAFGLMLGGLSVLALAASTVAGLITGVFLVGAGASALGPIIQTRLMDVARGGQALAAALNHSAFNIANALGAALGGFAIAAGFGYLAPIWVGLGLGAAGMLVATAGFALDRSREASRVTPTSEPVGALDG